MRALCDHHRLRPDADSYRAARMGQIAGIEVDQGASERDHGGIPERLDAAFDDVDSGIAEQPGDVD